MASLDSIICITAWCQLKGTLSNSEFNSSELSSLYFFKFKVLERIKRKHMVVNVTNQAFFRVALIKSNLKGPSYTKKNEINLILEKKFININIHTDWFISSDDTILFLFSLHNNQSIPIRMGEGFYNRICFSEWERYFIIGPGFTGGSVIFTYHSCNRMEFVFNNTTEFVM